MLDEHEFGQFADKHGFVLGKAQPVASMRVIVMCPPRHIGHFFRPPAFTAQEAFFLQEHLTPAGIDSTPVAAFPLTQSPSRRRQDVRQVAYRPGASSSGVPPCARSIRSFRTGPHRRHGQRPFKCPSTGMNVQHWMAEPLAGDEKQCAYEGVTCPACTRVHFINWSTGKVLGER